MSRRLAVLIAIAACAIAVASADAAGGRSESVVVYGYPYATQCPGAGIAEVVDRWGMYACNCTSYVAWALHANGQRIDWFIRGSMDAWNWPHVARLAGLRVDETPSVGAVAVWPRVARPFGHVAYVIGLSPGGTFDVAEYNFPALDDAQTFGFDTRAGVRSRGAVFIHVPRRHVAPLP